MVVGSFFLFSFFFKSTAIDYNITRGSNPVESTTFKIVQVAGSRNVSPEPTFTLTQGAETMTESTNDTTSCNQDIVCICFDASKGTGVSIGNMVCNLT